jgi:hypothetical protein
MRFIELIALGETESGRKCRTGVVVDVDLHEAFADFQATVDHSLKEGPWFFEDGGVVPESEEITVTSFKERGGRTT